jgi:metal-dependent amidase/aminoacylase/carboxypeptidase family protein
MDIKERIARGVGDRAGALIALSTRIHSHPETAWEEHRAAAWVAEMLDAGGFGVTPSYLGLETALLAAAGSGPYRVGICAEYDALPGLGHACGHNLTAATSVGAARRAWSCSSSPSPWPRPTQPTSTAARCPC